MADSRRGERDIKLNGISYKLILNMSVISEFESVTGHDFIQKAIAATSAYADAMECDTVLQRAEILSFAVTRNDAAHLFYLAAKQGNSQVELEEIEEAFIDDLDLANDAKFYPAIFVDLVSFALSGNNTKKKVKT